MCAWSFNDFLMEVCMSHLSTSGRTSTLTCCQCGIVEGCTRPTTAAQRKCTIQQMQEIRPRTFWTLPCRLIRSLTGTEITRLCSMRYNWLIIKMRRQGRIKMRWQGPRKTMRLRTEKWAGLTSIKVPIQKTQSHHLHQDQRRQVQMHHQCKSQGSRLVKSQSLKRLTPSIIVQNRMATLLKQDSRLQFPLLRRLVHPEAALKS
mmetsp:Transcript_144330/g.262476  ORF Transcript_144330/g.262476 Transcript_144330/m.262476 type:complete len:203 (+) Transcript_144330:69-677(+)